MHRDTSLRYGASPALSGRPKSMLFALQGCTVLAAFIFVSALVLGVF